MTTSCDVVVLGLGPGGEATASSLATAGLDVVGVDERLVGGECPYFGCIPSKMIIRAADSLAEAHRVGNLAGAVDVRPDWTPVATRIRDEATTDWDDTIAVERLEKTGARFVRGHGRLAGAKAVEVDGERYEARIGVVLNTGTAPAVPPIEGLADTPFWTNRDILRADSLPASLAVIGGGAIGVELAQAVARFGVEVTVLEIGEHLLPPEEPEAGRLLADVLAAEGVRVRNGASIASVGYADGAFTVVTDQGEIAADKLLVAAGRRPNLGDIGLDTVGLDPAARSLDVDDRMRVPGVDGLWVDGLWAIGDITGKGAFTHMSMYQSDIAAADVRGEDFPAADYRAVGRVTFTDPEIGSVGLSERSARDQGISVRTGTSDLAGSTRGWIAKAQGLVKLVADDERDVLVGATVVGPSGGEVLSMLTLAVQAEVPVSTLRRMHYAYPTFHRAVLDALGDLG